MIFTKNDGAKIYVELKNKHNTMNSNSSQKTYMKLSSKALQEVGCECFLVEIVAKASQNIPWNISLDGERVGNEIVRRVSIDKFYGIITGDNEAFFKLCKILSIVIERILEENEKFIIEDDTVIDELKLFNRDLYKALYLLAFSIYEGFENF